jgi:hypothetical protein
VPNQSPLGNDNNATLDLGPSLGVRRIGLDGTLAASITFNDAFDGGQPGDVSLSIPGPQPAGDGLVSTSVPLLGNSNVSTMPPSANANTDGCVGVLPTTDIESFTQLAASDTPSASTDNNLGNLTTPFPGTATFADTVLRTGSLSLNIGDPSADTSAGVPVGRSGGVANLFGLTPAGAPAGTNVDVKVTLFTNINSIIRTVDAASLAPPAGVNPFGSTDCRQAWSGAVGNFLRTELAGNLRISPAITGDGQLRIARVTLSGGPINQAVTACLVPFNVFSGTIAALPAPPGGFTPGARNAPPTAAVCNTPGPIQAAHAAALVGAGGPDAPGAEVKVTGDLSVPHLSAEVLVG